MLGESNTLRQARITNGKSVEEVADAIHVNPKTIYRYETGKQSPNVFIAIRLADYYNMTVRDLFHTCSSQEEDHEKDRSSNERRQ